MLRSQDIYIHFYIILHRTVLEVSKAQSLEETTFLQFLFIHIFINSNLSDCNNVKTETTEVRLRC